MPDQPDPPASPIPHPPPHPPSSSSISSTSTSLPPKPVPPGDEDHDYANPEHLEIFRKALLEDPDECPIPGSIEQAFPCAEGSSPPSTSCPSSSPSSSSSSSSSPPPSSSASRRQRRSYRTPFSAPESEPSPAVTPPPRRSGFTYTLFRYPIMLTILSIILFELTMYAMVRQIVNFWEHFVTWRGPRQRLRHRLRSATSYQEWKEAAEALDSHLGRDTWKRQPADPYYDWRLVRKLNRQLRVALASRDTHALADLLGSVKDNVGGIESKRLYSQAYYGTKDLVQSFLHHTIQAVRVIGDLDPPPPSLAPSPTSPEELEERRDLLRKVDRHFGRTALCLSGGAAFGYYHFGVIKALIHAGMLPKVIAGTSAGSLIAAITCVRTDEELLGILRPDLHSRIRACTDSIMTCAQRFHRTGATFDPHAWARVMQWATFGSMTFLEAYQRTGRILNITAVPLGGQTPTKVLNYLTAPHCIIWTAVLASSAIPGVLPPVVLLMKDPQGRAVPYMGAGHKWCDGSLRTDIPLESLKFYFNVRFTIVSQVNPHIRVFFYEPRGSPGRPSSHLAGGGWRGGFLLSSLEHLLKLELTKWLRICRDLELIPHFLSQDWSFIWLQRFHGQVTILPKPIARDFVDILSDPSGPRLAHYLAGGERSVWPRLLMIGNRMKLEQAIAEARRSLRRASLLADEQRNPEAHATSHRSPFHLRSLLPGGRSESDEGGGTGGGGNAQVNGEEVVVSLAESGGEGEGDEEGKGGGRRSFFSSFRHRRRSSKQTDDSSSLGRTRSSKSLKRRVKGKESPSSSSSESQSSSDQGADDP
ncbi:MAG: lipase [Piptocephalis tieghemiana]|nr:MAG: lipase [Piptocephalis tieghemiana]